MKKIKILEIGPYPPPNSGWSVRIKYLKDSFNKLSHDCKVLNLGKGRMVKSNEYIGFKNGFDYIIKLVLFRLQGYHLHMHMNGQSVKGPILSLAALLISICSFDRAALTFHGGIEQLFFPKRNAGKMYWIIYLNFLLSKVIVCNNESIKQEITNYGMFISEKKINPIPAFSIQYLSHEKVVLPQKINDYISEKKHVICCYVVLRNGFFLETLIGFLKRQKSDIGTILIGIRKIEDDEIFDCYLQLKDLESKGTVLLVDDLDHDQFMTLLPKTDLYLRTPVSDGVSSSVLEALALRVPVVASENGRRPEGVISFNVDDVSDLDRKVQYVLNHGEEAKFNIPKTVVSDTIIDEINLLVNNF